MCGIAVIALAVICVYLMRLAWTREECQTATIWCSDRMCSLHMHVTLPRTTIEALVRELGHEHDIKMEWE